MHTIPVHGHVGVPVQVDIPSCLLLVLLLLQLLQVSASARKRTETKKITFAHTSTFPCHYCKWPDSGLETWGAQVYYAQHTPHIILLSISSTFGAKEVHITLLLPFIQWSFFFNNSNHFHVVGATLNLERLSITSGSRYLFPVETPGFTETWLVVGHHDN